ncbi:MAG TPA: YciI family protein [Bdellovibrionales bacterium]|nr:YciI family protein [Bdellovibrionales bacterium]
MNLYTYKITLKAHYHDLKNWDAKTQAVFGEHAAYLKTGLDSGKVLIVGRTDTALDKNFGLAVFKAENESEARAFMQADPVVVAGIMDGEVYPFKLFMVTDEARSFNIW